MYKKLEDSNNDFIFDKPMTFNEANQMLVDAATMYRLIGKSVKVGYRIIQYDTQEVIFNSKVNVNKDVETLFLLLKENQNTPKDILDYADKVEKGEVEENIEIDPFINDIEQKTHIDQLKAEKNDILQKLKIQEKESRDRELEYEQSIQRLQKEKEEIEQSIAVKEQEEEEKESERIQRMKEIEEEKKKAEELAAKKRVLDKQRKEEHERKLQAIENEKKKAEFELASIEEENNKKEIERTAQLQQLAAKQNESKKKAEMIQAEGDKKDVEHQRALLDYTSDDEEMNNSSMDTEKEDSMAQTLKEATKGIKFKNFDVKQCTHVIANGGRLAKDKCKQAVVAYKENKKKERDLNEQLGKAKLEILNEIQKDKKQIDKNIHRELKQKEKEAASFKKKENRYLKEIRRRKTNTIRATRPWFITVSLVVIFLIGGNYLYELYLNQPDSLPNIVHQVFGVIEKGKNFMFQ